jgi:hypothetical protein
MFDMDFFRGRRVGVVKFRYTFFRLFRSLGFFDESFSRDSQKSGLAGCDDIADGARES